MDKKIEIYLQQDIDNPKYLFHGSPFKLEKITPKKSNDTNENPNNIAKAVFLFPSFLKSTPYAFKDTIKQNSEGLDWNFEIQNLDTYSLMIMSNVNVDEDIVGYVYVFEKKDSMFKDKDSYQYKCYEELYPCDIVKIHYRDFAKYYKVKN